jgi:PRTRC genetic system protein C
MALQTSSTTRKFVFNNQELSDPGAHMTPRQVAEHYSSKYSELTTAGIDGPVVEGGVETFTFRRAIGTKG